jgi:tellurite resistance protein TehA-like permease
MATGIVSIAAWQQGMREIAWVLFWFNVVAYGILWLLTLARLLQCSSRVIADLADHTHGPGFFTWIAGTCVLGSQFVLLAHDSITAIVLWFFGILLWLFMTYTFLAMVVVQEVDISLERGINGTWLLAIVATQAVSALGTGVAPTFGSMKDEGLFFTLTMYLIGCLLYLLIITLIFYRLVFFTVTPEALTAPYWINMGALAITSLAGSSLIRASAHWSFLHQLQHFLIGFTLFFWAAGTWWIPLLLILGLWRHLVKRYPLHYDVQYWGMVFPLGMYTASTFDAAKAMGLAFLLSIPHYSIYVALAAWAATALGLILSLTPLLLNFVGSVHRE